MHSINLLIGNSNYRVSNLIYSLVRGVCGPDVSIDCARASRVDHFLTEAVRNNFDLIIMNPEDLDTGSEIFRGRISIREAEGAIRSIKTLRSAPIIAVAVSPENELAFAEAGADLVLGLPFSCDEFKSAVNRLLVMPEEMVEAAAVRTSFATGFVRGWERLTEQLSFSKT